ncbi:MAG: sulfotransferase domain-containing protein [Flavobacteriaceae bacterium]
MKPQIVKVYSHTRSGTHFLEAFITENFYSNLDFSIKPITWGHWSNRKIKEEGNPYGKIFGNHLFPPNINDSSRKVYIKRDGRAVAYSMWKTPNFIHKNLKNISFQDFLELKIDWIGTPSNKANPDLTILEHWCKHVRSWEYYERINDNTLIVRYEDLIDNPYEQYLKIYKKFFNYKKLLTKDEITIIDKPVGLLPNMAKVDSWKEEFNKSNNEMYFNVLSKYNCQ